MRRLSVLFLVGPLTVGLAIGCESTGNDRVLGIEATGTVVGLAYLDRNGDGVADPDDGPVGGIGVGLVLPGTRDTTARTTTANDGTYRFDGIAVGRYRVVVDNATVADTLEVVKVDSADLTLAANDTAVVLINLGYPSVTAADARALQAGKRVAVRGVALNGWATFGDSTVHVADTTGALRTVRVGPSSLSAGDSIRLVGTTGTRQGQPVLTDVVAFVLGPAETPESDSLATATAAAADTGRLDAALVRIAGAAVLDSRMTTSGDLLLTVDDGSGALEVVLDRHAGFTAAPLPGAVVDATGVLVPSTGTAGRWQLKPRGNADLAFEYPTVTVAEARTLDPGRRVAIRGVALNGWAIFADSTVHLADSTGTLRAIRVGPANLFSGDSIRILGTISTRDGQPVLADVVASVFAQGPPPAPRQIATVDAAAASGGLDAALVRIVDATIADTATAQNGDFRLTVDDGSGAVEVVVDRDVAIQRSGLVPAAVIDATGVLVPVTGGGRWVVKPRSAGDLSVQ